MLLKSLLIDATIVNIKGIEEAVFKRSCMSMQECRDIISKRTITTLEFMDLRVATKV